MRTITVRSLLLIGVWIFLASAAAAQSTPPEDEPGLRLLKHLPRDPLLASVLTLEDPARTLDDMMGFIARFGEDEAQEISAKLEQLDAELGFSLRADFLANLGPEFALSLDLPPIDAAAGALAAPDQAVSLLLGKIGLLASVRDPQRIDSCLRRFSELAKAQVEATENGLVRVRLSLPDAEKRAEGAPAGVELFYGFRGNVAALGAAEEWVRSALDLQPGAGLADGEDFSRVFSQLDRAPLTLTYFNLPKVREMVESSAMLQSVIQANEEARQALEFFFSPDFVGMGVGSTSVEMAGGVRTTSFGPKVLGGGSMAPGIIAAIALPNLLHAIDRGKQKRTMADIRTIGKVCESFRTDHGGYPVATGEWVEVAELVAAVEPVYIRSLPTRDGWGNALLYRSDGQGFLILSRGKDGLEDRDWSAEELEESVTTESPERDIIFADGEFVVLPAEE